MNFGHVFGQFDDILARRKYGEEIQERVHRAIDHYAARKKVFFSGGFPPARMKLHGDRYWSWISALDTPYRNVEFAYRDDSAFMFCGTMIYTEENPDNTLMRRYAVLREKIRIANESAQGI
jgi:hypothetical protein